jgi:hypothetical protein
MRSLADPAEQNDTLLALGAGELPTVGYVVEKHRRLDCNEVDRGSYLRNGASRLAP